MATVPQYSPDPFRQSQPNFTLNSVRRISRLAPSFNRQNTMIGLRLLLSTTAICLLVPTLTIGAQDKSCLEKLKPAGKMKGRITATLITDSAYVFPAELAMSVLDNFGKQTALDRIPLTDFGIPLLTGVVSLTSPTGESIDTSNPATSTGERWDPGLEEIENAQSPTLKAKLSFTALRNGRVSDARIVTSSSDSLIDAKLLHAIAILSDSAWIAPLAQTLNLDAVQMTIEVTSGADVGRIKDVGPMTRYVERIIQKIMLPQYVDNTEVKMLRNPTVNYTPFGGGQESASVILHVDEKGRVNPKSLRISSGSSMLQQAIRDSAKGWRFKPATIGGCPVSGMAALTIVVGKQGY